MSNRATPVRGNAEVQHATQQGERQERVCQTSEAGEFPPLHSARQLKRERGTEKSKHTKLLAKITRYMSEKGSRSGLKVHRSALSDQLEECIAAHSRYVSADDYDENDDPDGANYIQKIENDTREMYESIDKYIAARSSCSQRSSASSVTRSSSRADSRIVINSNTLRNFFRAAGAEKNPVTEPAHQGEHAKVVEATQPFNFTLQQHLSSWEHQRPSIEVSEFLTNLRPQPPASVGHTSEKNDMAWIEETLEAVQNQLDQEMKLRKKIENELHRVSLLKSQNEAESKRLEKELRQHKTDTEQMWKKGIGELEEKLKRQARFDREAQSRAHDEKMRELESKMRRMEEISHASRNAADYDDGINWRATGAIPKKLNFAQETYRQQSCVFNEEDVVECSDTRKRAGKQPEKVLRSATCDDVASEKANRAESRWSFRERSPREDSSSQGHESVPRSSVFRIPKIDLDPFDGNPKNWPIFVANFRDLVDANDALSATQKMALLRKCLTSDIQASLGDCLNDPALYDQALVELESTYGHPHIISRTYIRSIKNLPKVTHLSDYKSLLMFSTTLRGAVASLRYGGYERELDGSLLEDIVEKLPLEIQSKWGMKIVKSYPTCLTLQDFVPWFHNIVKAQMVVKHATLSNKPASTNSNSNRNEKKQKPTTSVFATAVETKSDQSAKANSSVPAKSVKAFICSLCAGPHKLESCNEFIGKTLSERATIVKELRCCLRCLSKGHTSKACWLTKKCGVERCNGNHHTLLHDAPRLFSQPSENTNTERRAETTNAASTTTSAQPISGPHTHTVFHTTTSVSSVLLAVVPITVHNEEKSFDTYALIDSGSEATLILDHAAKRIALEGQSQLIKVSTFHGQDPNIQARTVNFAISARRSNVMFQTTNSLAISKLSLSNKKCNWPKVKLEWSHLADLDLPAVDSSRITVLLGRDVRGAHDILEQRRAPPGSLGPDAILTPFGWCVAGPVPSRVFCASNRLRIYHTRFERSEEQLRDNIAKLWETESFGYLKSNRTKLSSEDQRAMEILTKSIRHTGERQEAALMWKSDDVVVPNNRTVALRHLEQLAARFKKDPAYAEKYDKVVQEYIALGFASDVEPNDEGTPGRVWYMPHHGVTSVNKPDKVRVVFNCSARYQNVSLNDVLLKGPDLLTSQVGVLLRFRLKPIPIAADVEKMYHQVQVPEKDRSALRFLYCPPGSADAVKTYQMTRHVFGAISSPTTCIYALQKTAEDQRERFPNVADLVKCNTYVDNLLYSTETEDEAIRDAKDFKTLCKYGGFNVVQWMSSSRRFLSTVDPSELSIPNYEFQTQKLPVERTLGLLLDWEADKFLFRVNLRPAATMREVLQELSSVHDPLGLISPVLLPARILMQDIWRYQVGWDDILPQEIQNNWKNWVADVANLVNVPIPRCVRRVASPVSLQLHVFCDASEDGFGACVYFRATYSSDAVSVTLVLGKSLGTASTTIHSAPGTAGRCDGRSIKQHCKGGVGHERRSDYILV